MSGQLCQDSHQRGSSAIDAAGAHKPHWVGRGGRGYGGVEGGGGDYVEGGSNTSEGLLQLVPVGSAFQEASQGDDNVLKAGPFAGVFMPAVLHELEVVLNSGQGLTRQGLQGGQLWPLMLLSQHQHDLHRHCHCYSMVWQKNIAVPPKMFMCSDLELDRQNCFM